MGTMNTEKMQISASGIIKTAEFEFDINSVNHARLAVVINGTTYTAIYENNELKISIPDYVSLSMKITDMTAQGTVDIENLGRILINHLAFMNIRNGAFPILIPAESDIILQLGETDIKSKTLIENNIFQYQIESEISSSLKMTFEGKFGGQIDDFFNLETYNLVFANNFFVGTGYVSQEFNNDISLKNGIFNLKSHVNTILLKTDIEMRLSGLTLEKLILDNVLINTKIGEDELYVIGGVMYERNAIFAIKQTQVKLGGQNCLLISGSDTPIVFLLQRNVRLQPAKSVLFKIGQNLRIEGSHNGLKEFSILAYSDKNSPYLELTHGGKTYNLNVDMLGLVGQTTAKVNKNGFKQEISMMLSGQNILSGRHEINLKKQFFTVDWTVANVVIQSQGIIDQKLTIKILSDLFKTNFGITPKKLNAEIVASALHLKTNINKDLSDSFFLLSHDKSQIVSVQMDTIETFEISANTDFIIIADCTNACSKAEAVLLVSGEKIGQFNFELQQNGVSRLDGRFKDDNLIHAEFTTNHLKKLRVVAFDTELLLTPKVLSLRNTEYNFESELVFGRSALVHFELSKDLMVHFMGIHNGKMILNVQLYGFITFQSQLEDENLRSELNVHDYSINSLVNMNEAYMTVTGSDLEITGYASNDSFKVDVIKPENLTGSIEYKNEKMTIQSGNRIYNMVSENGLVRIIPSMAA